MGPSKKSTVTDADEKYKHSHLSSYYAPDNGNTEITEKGSAHMIPKPRLGAGQ